MSRSLVAVLSLSVVLAVAGCDSAVPSPAAPASTAASPGAAGATGTQTIQVGNRPFTLRVPATYQAGTAAPLLVLLHGYTSSGFGQEAYLRIGPEAEKRGVLYATPDGTTDARGMRFWNATDACCNLYGATVDDSAYLTDLIKMISTQYTVDPGGSTSSGTPTAPSCPSAWPATTPTSSRRSRRSTAPCGTT